MEKIFYVKEFDNISERNSILKTLEIENSLNRLLTREEEFHLFRKMNFLKYSGKTAEAIKIRNIIAQLNFKLAKQIKKYDEEILSDAYLDILNAVEYFDYRLGNKFSTYATWVLKKNYFRNLKNKRKSFTSLVDDVECYSEEEFDPQPILNILSELKNSNCRDSQRKYYIVSSYFGINCEKKSLLDLSQTLGISKERVRQIKQKALTWLNHRVMEFV